MRRHLLGPALVVVALVTAGCGGGDDGTSPSTSSAGSAGSTTASAGTTGTPADLQSATPRSEFAGDAGAKRFTAVAGTVCSTVVSGVPPAPRPGAQAAERRAYDAALAQAAGRLGSAVVRLGQQRPASQKTLRALATRVDDVGRLADVAAGDATSTASSAAPLRSAIGRLRDTAVAAELPACSL